MGGELLLNVASTMARSRANGPGIRAVVWVQGCTIGCSGCYNEFTHPHKIESLYTPSEVAKWILSIDGIDGVTFSGGEPFEQAKAVLQVIKEIKQEKQLDVFVFSGYTYAKLVSSTDNNVNQLLLLFIDHYKKNESIDSIKNYYMQEMRKREIKIGDGMKALRLCISGKLSGVDLFSIIYIIKNDIIIKRINNSLKLIND